MQDIVQLYPLDYNYSNDTNFKYIDGFIYYFISLEKYIDIKFELYYDQYSDSYRIYINFKSKLLKQDLQFHSYLNKYSLQFFNDSDSMIKRHILIMLHQFDKSVMNGTRNIIIPETELPWKYFKNLLNRI